MQCRHGSVSEILKKRKMKEINMKVNHVELVCLSAQLVQHGEMRGEIGLQRARVETDRLIPDRNEIRSRSGISTGEQRHLVTDLDQRVGEMRHDSLGATVESRWHGLV